MKLLELHLHYEGEMRGRSLVRRRGVRGSNFEAGEGAHLLIRISVCLHLFVPRQPSDRSSVPSPMVNYEGDM